MSAAATYAPATTVDHFAAWCEAYAVQSIDRFAGHPLVLEPWQREFMSEALALDEAGHPYWRLVVLVVPRKNGKSSLLSAYATYHAAEDDGQPEVLLSASSDKQAARLFDYSVAFIRRSPRLAAMFHLREHVGVIARIDGGARMVRMASDPKSAHGANPSLVIVDELHAFTTPSLRRFWAAQVSAGGARSNSQVFSITTAGEAHEREDSILGQLIDRNEFAGVEEHGALRISRNHDARVLIYNYQAPTRSRHDFAAIRAANPASWVSDSYLRERIADPGTSDAELLQLHACVWADSARTFIAGDAWDALGDGEPIPEGAMVCLGADGSRTHDTTAVAWAHLASDGRIDLDCRVFSVRAEAAHHELHHGHIDYERVEAFIEDRFAFYDVAEAAYDPRYLQRSADILEARLPEAALAAVEPSSRLMRDALATFHRAVTEGRIRHQGDPVLRAHLAACQAEQDERGWQVRKVRHSKPIDAVIAMALAVWRVDVAAHVPAVWAASW